MREKDFQWVRQIILSCTQPFQFEACENMIKFYRRKYIYEAGVMEEYFTLMELLEAKYIPLIIEFEQN